MSPRRVALAVWDFVVGDDWRPALAAVAAIGLTALAGAWWLAPLIALAALAWSLRGAHYHYAVRYIGERTADPGLLALAGLIEGPKHGYAVGQDGALSWLRERVLIEALPCKTTAALARPFFEERRLEAIRAGWVKALDRRGRRPSVVNAGTSS